MTRPVSVVILRAAGPKDLSLEKPEILRFAQDDIGEPAPSFLP